MANGQVGWLEQLQGVWKRLTLRQRLALVIFSAAAAITLLAVTFLMSSPDYRLLYSNLSAEEAAAVVGKLKERKIPFEIEEGGAAIKIPAEKLNEVRLQLASEGLPQGGRIGFEIFDRTNFGLSDFAAQVNYRRALEGELERTIGSIAEVAQARVHLVLPKDSLFSEKAEEAKASVVIRLKAGKQLSQGSVSGIIHLIASAVEGLKPENVSIIDDHGKILSPMRGNEDGRLLTASELELQRSLEKELTAKVLSVLEPALGTDKVRANASVQLDLSATEQTEELYDPNKSVILSQQKTEERILQPGSQGGIPGTRSNQPGTQPSQTSPTDARIKQSEIVNYEVSKTVRRTISPRGNIKKISIAVTVDDKVVYKKDKSGKIVASTARRTPEEMQRIKELVVAAVGFNAERGDQVTVENISFEKGPPEEEPAREAFLDRYAPLVKPALKYLGLITVFFAAYLLLLRPMKKQLLEAITEAALPEPQPASQELAGAASEAAKMLTSTTDADQTEAKLQADAASVSEAASPQGQTAAIIKNRIVELVKKDPEMATHLVRVWLQEE